MKILSTFQCAVPAVIAQLRGKRSTGEDVSAVVREIIQNVKTNGDKAIFELAKRFDGASLSTLRISQIEIREAYKQVGRELLLSLQRAKENIEIFHTSILCKKENVVESEDGVRVWREFRPIEKVGLYVPGGKASYPSTVLMLAIPAKVAGCREIVMCVPSARDGTVNPAVLVAADMCGITKIFKVGGAQAIAAMAYGTESIPQVSKIFGPGNQYVTTAKMLVYGQVAIDMPAGPSEVAVVADESANPAWVAADLLSQLEHGEDSQAVLVTPSEEIAKTVLAELKKQTALLERKEIIKKSFLKSFIVIVRSLEEAIQIVNEYAPEHLEIVTKNPAAVLKKIINAGSVFLGPYASEPLGDYATGANHTLPTSGFATMFPPLSTESFGKMLQIQKVSKRGMQNLRQTVETLANAEGLSAHKNAVTIRFL